MPFPMKIQPIDFLETLDGSTKNEYVKPLAKSRFKRLIERQFPSVLRSSSLEKSGSDEPHLNKDNSTEFDPSSICLGKMVLNYIEEGNEKQSAAGKCGRKRCNCFNGSCSDSSEDEYEISAGEANGILKSLVPCASVHERNLLADTAKMFEKSKIFSKPKDHCRQIIVEGLLALGYDASICTSTWKKSASSIAGKYEYIDVIVNSERLLIDIDFRSEFEIARPTKTYSSVLQMLPYIFVGKSDRLQKIVSIISEAAKQSIKKKGMSLPPWRKAEYVKAKWLSPYTRTTLPLPTTLNSAECSHEIELKTQKPQPLIRTKTSSGDFDLIFGEKMSPDENNHTDSVFSLYEDSGEDAGPRFAGAPAKLNSNWSRLQV